MSCTHRHIQSHVTGRTSMMKKLFLLSFNLRLFQLKIKVAFQIKKRKNQHGMQSSQRKHNKWFYNSVINENVPDS